ncbi:DBF zinc finger protein-like protein [Dinothrombium tinctorium]|uniref:DBF zinc finger protein-like protein n=1 Tax=Dinothrombium tinctorium TaxID=1965070 RepID=A0A3S3PSZ8_9ACAR|nr:DBF zinc finger protein-like protein [Dinothrombium tinctorium]
MKTNCDEMSSQPLKGCTFYLDLSKYPQLRPKIVAYIKQLGGNVEEFLSRRISHLVTDKPKKEWPKAKEKEVELEAATSEDSAISAQRAAAARNGLSPNCTANRLELLSRGRVLALRAGAQTAVSSTTTDTLELAYKKGVKIIFFASFLRYCEQFSNLVNGVSNNSNAVALVKAHILNGHYIKVEDEEKKYKPSVKELAKWPEVNFDTSAGSCPFGTKNKPKKVTGTTIEATTNATLAKSLDNVSVPKQNVNENKVDVVKERTKPVKKAKVTQTCEICSEEFINTFEHVNTPKHQDFVRNTDNFVELLRVIESLPKYDLEISDTSRGIDSDENHVSPPHRTSPTATTFTLKSVASRSSGSFLRLQDVIEQSKQSQSSPPPIITTQQQSPKNTTEEQDNFQIVEASTVTPTKDPLYRLRNREIRKNEISEEF